MITLLALGDICPGDHYFTLGHGLGRRLAAGWQPLAPVMERLRAADLVIANLEGALADQSGREGPVEGVVFRGAPAVAGRLREAGIGVAHLANNHAMQHGEAAFRATVSALERSGIAPLGLRGRGFACAPLVRQVGALVVGFLGYSRVSDGCAPGQSAYAAPSDAEMLADVQAFSRHVDALVVSIHWGDEGVELPSPEVIALGRALVEAGARVVLGHHPHVFQPVMRHAGGIIAFSLGDALFDLFWHPPLVESALLEVRLERGRVPEFTLVPVRFHRDYLLKPEGPRAAAVFLDRLDEAAAWVAGLPSDEYAAVYARRLARAVRALNRRKLPFFLRNLPWGASRHKAAFLCRKLGQRRAAL
jgi:poly-gamma-glutamate synthesis protein (capsule biosynthesis protein)